MTAAEARALAADLLATSRALAARGVVLPAMYVVEKGEAVTTSSCDACGSEDEPEGDPDFGYNCPDCSARGCWTAKLTFPAAVRLPDLASPQNGDAVLGLIREAKLAYVATWVPESKEHSNGGHHVAVFGHTAHRSKHLAHAAAKAWLAWLVWRAGQ